MDTSIQKNNRPKGMPTAVKYGIGLIILIVAFLIGYLPKRRNSEKIDVAAQDLSKGAPEVETVEPRLASAGPLNLPGTIQALLTTSVQARANGYITKMYVDIGSRVKAGQVLADIQSPDVDQQLVQAGAQTEQSRATVSQSQADVQRLNAGVIESEADLAHQRAAIVQSQAAVSGSVAKKEQAEAGLLQSKAALLKSLEQVKVQQAGLSQAEAQFALAGANRKRYTELLAQGFVSQQDYDQAEATFRTQGATIASAKANISAAEADVKAAQEVVRSSEDLIRSAESDRQAAIANLKAAQASLQSSAASLLAAKSSVVAQKSTVNANVAAVGSSVANQARFGVLKSFEHVVAPFDGIITARNVDVGSLVTPGVTSATDANSSVPATGLFGIAKFDILRVYVNVPQSSYRLATVGTRANISVREFPKNAFTGVVHQQAGALDTSTRTLLTEIRVPNPRGVLLPGMYALVQFSGTNQKSIRVPAEALLIDAQGTRVVIVKADNKIHYQDVVLGRDYGTESDVTNGVSLGDRLVSNPTDDLKEGEVVKPQAEQAEAPKS
jgi:multidrug efflux system membrane fusion protein